jgi:glucose-1-phosphate adenylyltransferase
MHAVTVAPSLLRPDFQWNLASSEAETDGAIHGFHKKSGDAPTIPGEPDKVYASMGNYVFTARTLFRELEADAIRTESRRDFGRDILPAMLDRTSMYAYDYRTNVIPGESGEVMAFGGMQARWRHLTRPKWICAGLYPC